MQYSSGIDPGLQGAIYIRNHTPEIEGWIVVKTLDSLPAALTHQHIFIDNSLLLIPQSKEWSDAAFLTIFEGVTDAVAAIECVGGMPRNQGMFRFGQGYQGLRLALAIQGIPFSSYRPQEWHKDVGLLPGSSKDESWELATTLHPELTEALLTKRGKKLDGRAEAVLIHDVHLNVLNGASTAKPAAPVAATKRKRTRKTPHGKKTI